MYESPTAFGLWDRGVPSSEADLLLIVAWPVVASDKGQPIGERACAI